MSGPARDQATPPGVVQAVDDPADPRLSLYRDLTDAQLRRQIEAERRVFVVEGHLAVRALLASPYEVRSMLVADARTAAVADLTAAVTAAGANVFVAPMDVLAAIVGFEMHRGVVALGARPAPADPTVLLDTALRRARPVVALVEGVNDHENLGAIYRNAAALGVGAVLLDPTCADPLYRRCVRVSVGHVLTVPWARLDDWPGSLSLVADAGFAVVALTPSPAAPELARTPTGRPVGVLIGAEGPGLAAGTLAAVGEWARIAMAPGVDSLNVATAAAIAFHHFAGGGGR